MFSGVKEGLMCQGFLWHMGMFLLLQNLHFPHPCGSCATDIDDYKSLILRDSLINQERLYAFNTPGALGDCG